MIVAVPRRTSQSPENCHVGGPDLFSPRDEEVHVSCVFTWDKPEAERIAAEWRDHGNPVKVGGPAYDDRGGEFTPGLFIRKGYTITSRGCDKNCPWCYVPKREGKIRELEVKPGNIIQDNNILACSRRHLEKVFEMLGGQRAIAFRGGLDSRLFAPDILDRIRSLRIAELWFAMDSKAGTRTLDTIRMCRQSGISQGKIRCYALLGFNGESLSDGIERCKEIFRSGALPFAQVFDGRKFSTLKEEREWRRTARQWQRPAIMKAIMSERKIKPECKHCGGPRPCLCDGHAASLRMG